VSRLKKPAPVERRDTITMIVDNVAEAGRREAIGFYRAGRPGRAEFALVRAGMRIAHLIGDRESFATLSDLKLVEPFKDPRTGDLGAVS